MLDYLEKNKLEIFLSTMYCIIIISLYIWLN